MEYIEFEIEHYRAIEKPLFISLNKTNLIPFVGINECGKTTILQAIYCFDFVNDEEYEGRHLKDTNNLYLINDTEALITAHIKVSYNKLLSAFKTFVEVRNEGKEESEQVDSDFPLIKSEYEGVLKIQRNLSTREYQVVNFDYYPDSDNKLFAKRLVSKLPYILYNDDFIDRPPSVIRIPNTVPETLTGWLAVYDRVFQEATSRTIFSVTEIDDPRVRKAIISDVTVLINKTLSKAWKTFLLSNQQSIDVTLELDENKDPEIPDSDYELIVQIKENIGQRERFFDVVDRSKGFLWFFNFVMKLQFNPKIVGQVKDTIHLLDEPGSYLHASAQEKLCNKLKEISEKNGKVLYCTHSHHLLNPDKIPHNNIHIVEKDSKKNISATPLPKVRTKIESNSAYQPIHNALESSVYTFKNSTEKSLAVEGIYDKYSIEIFVNSDLKYNIIPGTSANSIVKNIQFLNGFGKDYICYLGQ